MGRNSCTGGSISHHRTTGAAGAPGVTWPYRMCRREPFKFDQPRANPSLNQMYEIFEHTMTEAPGIKLNLDFPTGPAYYLLGFDIDVFTPIFVMSRITGWTAHIIEQGEGNALIRPLSKYVGVPQRAVLA
ncbi:citrate/2-methylcitrate synthase [Nocardia thailandica]|uniref:citrate synthase (unknown stereospecificity) n=1 Tax=Nocardia thailandica TaxID=257275 RepID=A0ABW6PLS5_9NOCA